MQRCCRYLSLRTKQGLLNLFYKKYPEYGAGLFIKHAGIKNIPKPLFKTVVPGFMSGMRSFSGITAASIMLGSNSSKILTQSGLRYVLLPDFALGLIEDALTLTTSSIVIN